MELHFLHLNTGKDQKNNAWVVGHARLFWILTKQVSGIKIVISSLITLSPDAALILLKGVTLYRITDYWWLDQSCAVRFAIVFSGNLSHFALLQWLPICTQISSSLRALLKFQDDPLRVHYFLFFLSGLYTVELPGLWPAPWGEKNSSSKTFMYVFPLRDL